MDRLILLFSFSAVRGWAQLSHVPLDQDYDPNAKDRNFDFDRREEMIPMRDGVNLFTVILIPRTNEPMPIMLTRTPYGAAGRYRKGRWVFDRSFRRSLC